VAHQGRARRRCLARPLVLFKYNCDIKHSGLVHPPPRGLNARQDSSHSDCQKQKVGVVHGPEEAQGSAGAQDPGTSARRKTETNCQFPKVNEKGPATARALFAHERSSSRGFGRRARIHTVAITSGWFLCRRRPVVLAHEVLQTCGNESTRPFSCFSCGRQEIGTVLRIFHERCLFRHERSPRSRLFWFLE